MPSWCPCHTGTRRRRPAWVKSIAGPRKHDTFASAALCPPISTRSKTSGLVRVSLRPCPASSCRIVGWSGATFPKHDLASDKTESWLALRARHQSPPLSLIAATVRRLQWSASAVSALPLSDRAQHLKRRPKFCAIVGGHRGQCQAQARGIGRQHHAGPRALSRPFWPLSRAPRSVRRACAARPGATVPAHCRRWRSHRRHRGAPRSAPAPVRGRRPAPSDLSSETP